MSRKPSSTPETIAKARAALEAGKSYAEAADAAGLSHWTIGRLSRQGKLPQSGARRRTAEDSIAKARAALEAGASYSEAARAAGMATSHIRSLANKGALPQSAAQAAAIAKARAALEAGASYSEAARTAGMATSRVQTLARKGSLPKSKAHVIAIGNARAAIEAGSTYAAAARAAGMTAAQVYALVENGTLPKSTTRIPCRDLASIEALAAEMAARESEPRSKARAVIEAGGTFLMAARASGLSSSTISNLSRSGLLPPSKNGGRPRGIPRQSPDLDRSVAFLPFLPNAEKYGYSKK